jgi:hypothetical protein
VLSVFKIENIGRLGCQRKRSLKVAAEKSLNFNFAFRKKHQRAHTNTELKLIPKRSVKQKFRRKESDKPILVYSSKVPHVSIKGH